MSNVISVTKPYLKPAMIGLLSFYVLIHFFSGEGSLLSYFQNKDKIAALEAEHEGLAIKREALEQRVQLMQPESLDKDMLDEQTRKILGVAKDDEVIIFLD